MSLIRLLYNRTDFLKDNIAAHILSYSNSHSNKPYAQAQRILSPHIAKQ